MADPDDSDKKRFINLNRPQGTVIGDFAQVVNNFFSTPNLRSYIIAIILVLGLILVSLWVIFIPLFNPPASTVLPVLTSTFEPTITPTITPTTTPLYAYGLLTFLSKESGTYRLYALPPYGDRIPLLDVPGDANLKILDISPEQAGSPRYLVVQYELDQKPVLAVLSSDGQQKTTINDGNAFGRVIYLPDGRLLVDIHEGSSIAYKRFAIDGSNPVTVYTTQTQLTPTP